MKPHDSTMTGTPGPDSEEEQPTNAWDCIKSVVEDLVVGIIIICVVQGCSGGAIW